MGGDARGNYGVRFTPASKLRGGVYLQDVVSIIFGREEYTQYKDAIDVLLKYNSGGGLWPISYGIRDNPSYVSGLLISPEGRVFFVNGNTRSIGSDAAPENREAYFGGADEIVGEDDTQKVTAEWMLWLRTAREFSKKRYSLFYYCTLPACPVSEGGVPYDHITKDEVIVELK